MSLFTSAGQLYEFWYLKKRICTLRLKPLLESSDVFSVLHLLNYVTLALNFCLRFVLVVVFRCPCLSCLVASLSKHFLVFIFLNLFIVIKFGRVVKIV